MTSKEAVQDWLRVHRLLIEREGRFTDLAIQAAAGEVSPAALAQHRAELMALRALCTSAYEKAFPAPPAPGPGG